MKRLIQILFFCIVTALGVGFYIKNYQENTTGDIIIGVSIIAIMFVLMPLFIYSQSKGKKLKDYMLTQENLEKMRDKKAKKR